MKFSLWSFSFVISFFSLWTTPITQWRSCINKHLQLALPQSSLNQCLGVMCELISNVQPCMNWGRLKLLDLLGGCSQQRNSMFKVFAFEKVLRVYMHNSELRELFCVHLDIELTQLCLFILNCYPHAIHSGRRLKHPLLRPLLLRVSTFLTATLKANQFLAMLL